MNFFEDYLDLDRCGLELCGYKFRKPSTYTKSFLKNDFINKVRMKRGVDNRLLSKFGGICGDKLRLKYHKKIRVVMNSS